MANMIKPDRFEVVKEPFGRFERYRIANPASGESVAIIPGFGSNVNQLVLRKGYPISVIDGDYAPGSLERNEAYRGAKLTPFPNRVRDGVYSFGGMGFLLALNFPEQVHAIHGLLYDRAFEVFSGKEGPEGSLVTFHEYDGGMDGYPFPFSIRIRHALTHGSLSVETEVVNEGDTEMPFGDGWHPYFGFSLPDKGKWLRVDDLHLQIPAEEVIVVDERMIPTGSREYSGRFLSLSKIGDEELDTGFKLRMDGFAETLLRSELYDATLRIRQETGEGEYSYLQVFTHPSRRSLAIQPMTCTADAFNNGEGLIVLGPGEVFRSRYGVSLD